ncbi:MAG: ferredoxin [Spirochaetales bacterium]|nr:ferredoxin [Spirochaetales bacterium]
MKIECIIDGKILSLAINSNKPLLDILTENIDNESILVKCRGNHCGNCVVLLDGEAVLSCLVPAFELRSKTILTFEGFSKTKNYRDIERAYNSTGHKPCQYCYNSKTLLIESIVNRYSITNTLPDISELISEMNIIKCNCLDIHSFKEIIYTTISYRKRRNVRKS